MLGNLLWGAPEWLWPAVGIVCVIAAVATWAYLHRLKRNAVHAVAFALKLLAIVLLAVCLLDPMRSGTKPRPQANLFPLLVDNSQSMSMRASDGGKTRGDRVGELMQVEQPWRVRLAQDFDVRPYRFASRLEPLPSVNPLTLDGGSSSLSGSLRSLRERLQDRPVAGVLVFTDGNLTDESDSDSEDWSTLGFPVYPVIPSKEDSPGDLRIVDVSVSQSDFETAPVSIKVSIASQSLTSSGNSAQPVVIRLEDQQTDKLVQEQVVALKPNEQSQPVTIKFRPEKPGIGFYRVVTFREQDRALVEAGGEVTSEATFANNSRWLSIDRGRGPHRILYVAGRPNWEFKFIRRALQADPEVQLVGLLRIANKEAKFSFRDREVSSANPLFAGVGGDEEEAAQQYDEPVMVRLGVEASEELSAGFPRTSDELFGYEAIILDDIEPEFFTQDQLLMLRRFVTFRGGGLLMLGGQESFDSNRFGTSPLGELSPVYPPRRDETISPDTFRIELTREGLLQPWVRLRETESQELERLQAMPQFNTINPVGDAKPGAIQLAAVRDHQGKAHPGFVVQRFGKGKTAALAIGDLWKWSMRREKDQDDEPARLWRQTMRWLVNDVPKQVQSQIEIDPTEGGQVTIRTEVRDEFFMPMDNVKVEVEITSIASADQGDDQGNDQTTSKPVQLLADVDNANAGTYQASFFASQSGGYLATVKAFAEDGSDIGTTQAGWISQPGEAEFRQWAINRDYLQKLAEQTGGELVEDRSLDSFVADLNNRRVPVSQTWTYPIWHHPWVMLAAIMCLCGEWGLRRWRGMP
jgi:uncharacterized membrane protein